ncbi:PD-(D/E)XK nuclease family protein, partial [Beijerinckia sp. L45]|uniref:PD-(D/E)XK nuclease family protein n=1 Tax=Beijerinckia sp. L45 TaxID=1641855 RepID=UPI001AEF08FE
MEVVFGQWTDPAAFPEHGGLEDAALGAPVVGPNGLLDILETARGLGSPPTASVVRIAAFQAVLERIQDGPRFWSRSLTVDAWATARTLLRWRDELIDAGWHRSDDWSEARLQDLAAADEAASGMPLGLADRVAALVADLASRPRLPIARIRLIDPRELHSAGWRRLLDSIEACNVAVEPISTLPAAPASSALGRLQRWMLSGVQPTGGPDGTVTVATSASAALAAEVVGQWFAADPVGQAVLVAQDSDTDLLDHGLCGAGQPRAGRSRPSPHRGSLQILLLGFKVGWAPFDAHALMQLLVFPTSPIAPRASRLLAAALEDAPGRGGIRWTAAWSLIEEAETAEADGDKAKVRAARVRIDRWRAWADPDVADPDAGMPLQTALAVCDRTISWALARHADDSDPLYRATATLASDVRKALVALGRSHLPRTLVERIVDQALDVGQANPNADAEASRWRCVPHPGAVWAPTPIVVWWNFRATAAWQRQPWTRSEREELTLRGCPPDDVALAGRAASSAWERAVLNARDHVLLIAGGLDSGDEEAMHPLAYRMASATERLADRIRLEDATTSASLILAGRLVLRIPVETVALPAPRARWSTPTGYAARMIGRTQSATSFENLLSCQLMWALKHVAGLRAGRSRSIPDANRLLGNLAHAIACEIFQPGLPPSREKAAEMTERLLDGRIDELAAPLRHPELAAQLSDARERLPAAMAVLAQTLTDNDLTVEATELQVSGDLEEALAIRGAVDLVTRDRDSNAVILDLKWTRSARTRLDELKTGTAVQLATYGALVSPEAPYRAGYFLLNQRQFATLSGSGLIGRRVEGSRGFPATWAAIRESWTRLCASADAGGLVARGVTGWRDHLPEDLPMTREVRC